MNTLIRLFDLDAESGQYNETMYTHNGKCHSAHLLRV